MSEENKNLENNENINNENVNDKNKTEETAQTTDNTELSSESGKDTDDKTSTVSLEKKSETDAVSDNASLEKTSDINSADAASEQNQNSNKNIITAIIAVAVVIVLAVAGYFMNKNGLFETNKYNRMGYINISGRTLDEVASASGMSTEDFKKEFQLPEDMPGSTHESAAFYNMPTSKIAEMYGMTFEDVVSLLGLPDTVTESTPWGEAEGEATLNKYVGEEAVEDFKKEYNLGDNVTGETKWKDIRNIVDQAALDKRLEDEKKAALSTPAAEGQELSEEEMQAIIDSMQQQSDADAGAANVNGAADGANANADGAAVGANAGGTAAGANANTGAADVGANVNANAAAAK